MRNINLARAKQVKNDEFYTLYEDIEAELQYYSNSFKGKVVYCNCDNPYESNFVKYFIDNFERLGLKELRATCWSGEETSPQRSLLDDDHIFQKPYFLCMDNPSKPMKDCIEILSSNGDFRSRECLHILEDSDVVVTNPPFSLFREFIDLMYKCNKRYLVVGSRNAVTYDNAFPFIKMNRMHYGFTSPKQFLQSDGAEKTFGNIGWFTNLEIDYSCCALKLTAYYDKNHYYRYENYDAINVDRLTEIPCDYDGIMGVPITILNHFDPKQFEIVGFPTANDLPLGWKGMSSSFVESYRKQGNRGHYNEGNRYPCFYDKTGKAIIPYARILIRNKHPQVGNICEEQ